MPVKVNGGVDGVAGTGGVRWRLILRIRGGGRYRIFLVVQSLF
jgi:hypothetical protein